MFEPLNKCKGCNKSTNYSLDHENYKDWYCEEHNNQNPCDSSEMFRKLDIKL